MNRNSSDKVLLGMALVFGAYVIIRAWNIPITVDECSTAVSHVPRSVPDLLFLTTDANPNNHILNTILIKVFTSLFGWYPIVVRFPALIGAFAYASGGFLLSRQLSKYGWISIFSYAMMLGQPYLLDFFSLARGYSLGLGCMIWAIWLACKFFKNASPKYLFWSFFFSGLAVYANFTQILFFIPLVFLLLFNAWQEKKSTTSFWKKTGPAQGMFLVWMLLLSVPLKKMSQHSEVQNWNRLDTLFGSSERSMESAIIRNPLFGHSAAHFLAYFAVVFTIGAIYFGFKKWVANGKRFEGRISAFLVLLLGSILFLNVIQVEITHTPYLQPRLALLYWPLFALSLGVVASWLYERSSKWAWRLMLPLSFVACINMAMSCNLNEAIEWWHDRDTYVVLDFLRNLQKTEGHPEPYTFDTYDAMQNSFIFHTQLDPRGYDAVIKLAEWHPQRPPTKDYEFYYAMSKEEAAPILDSFEVVLKVPRCERVLLRKKKITPF